jgi:hypothetical protein
VPSSGYDSLFAEEAGSEGMRGTIFGRLWLVPPNAYLAVYEKVECDSRRCERVEYAYFLVIDGDEVWGYEKDPTHEPPLHRHGDDHEREPADEVSFAEVAKMAWEEVSRR